MYDNGFVRRYMNLVFDYLIVYYFKYKKMKKINHIDNTFWYYIGDGTDGH